MGIYGIGIDIEEIGRIEEVLIRWGRTFTERIFTEHEIGYCEGRQRPSQHYAARFAAKEALSKALGTGWSGIFRWKDVEVRNSDAGQPTIFLQNKLGQFAHRKSIHLSISHSFAHVTAFVVIEQI